SNAVKNVPPLKEPAEHLVIQRVQPLAAYLDVMAAMNNRKVVLYIGPPDELINRRIEKERMTKSEGSTKAHGRVGGHIGSYRRAGSQLARIREVRFVELGGRQSRKQIYVEVIDLRRAFNAVCGI